MCKGKQIDIKKTSVARPGLIDSDCVHFHLQAWCLMYRGWEALPKSSHIISFSAQSEITIYNNVYVSGMFPHELPLLSTYAFVLQSGRDWVITCTAGGLLSTAVKTDIDAR